MLLSTLSIFAVLAQQNDDGRNIFQDKDFEDGSLGPWYDDSDGAVHWEVEDIDSPLETNNPAPTPLDASSKHARLVRVQSEFNPAVLRSPKFQAVPGDQVSFAFWVRSRYPKGNSLQVHPMTT